MTLFNLMRRFKTRFNPPLEPIVTHGFHRFTFLIAAQRHNVRRPNNSLEAPITECPHSRLSSSPAWRSVGNKEARVCKIHRVVSA
jgi:hypothetical protein